MEPVFQPGPMAGLDSNPRINITKKASNLDAFFVESYHLINYEPQETFYQSTR